ncbi:hypothetical protein P7H62_14965 [Vagococcus carniphilus]|uniref:hypothetical protein n=1 Tax=Vagococcus carniphilus TaxID=218144 RepID=UPI0028917D3A|nr:hypothetical protein [Vagococcus carniphilus]MDT2832270.1 hypothetical protein [Vagococcus carniphilus]MDT2841022.1 hypothetical protein [Vagococcus carniphilus]MDT2855757.1 hypothetical protein [Vagococcus carniphilus]
MNNLDYKHFHIEKMMEHIEEVRSETAKEDRISLVSSITLWQAIETIFDEQINVIQSNLTYIYYCDAIKPNLIRESFDLLVRDVAIESCQSECSELTILTSTSFSMFIDASVFASLKEVILKSLEQNYSKSNEDFSWFDGLTSLQYIFDDHGVSHNEKINALDEWLASID